MVSQHCQVDVSKDEWDAWMEYESKLLEGKPGIPPPENNLDEDPEADEGLEADGNGEADQPLCGDCEGNVENQIRRGGRKPSLSRQRTKIIVLLRRRIRHLKNIAKASEEAKRRGRPSRREWVGNTNSPMETALIDANPPATPMSVVGGIPLVYADDYVLNITIRGRIDLIKVGAGHSVRVSSGKYPSRITRIGADNAVWLLIEFPIGSGQEVGLPIGDWLRYQRDQFSGKVEVRIEGLE